MKLVKTVRCKLIVTEEQAAQLRETLNCFAQACNDILQASKRHKTSNKVRLQHLGYYAWKERYNLHANLVIRAIARVAAAMKKPHKPRSFKADSLDYDARTFRLIEYPPGTFKVSISTIAGRLKLPLAIGNYQRGLLKGQKPTAAKLVYDKRTGNFYIHIVLKKPVQTPMPRPDAKVVAVDLGINNIATTSNGLRFNGKPAMEMRRHYSRLRAALASKGTKGAQAAWKRLSGKEQRTMRDINHVISRRIVDTLEPGDVIVLENLTHIRVRTKVRKEQRYIHNSWPFRQLQSFVEYKALERGVAVAYRNPHHSSQLCSRCGALGSRNGPNFHCASCGHRNHADYNAAYNLQSLGLAEMGQPVGCPVNQP